MQSLFLLIDAILAIIFWVLIISAVLSWLVAFRVVNTSNEAVYMIYNLFRRLSDPILRPVRRVVPLFGGVDISPIIVLLAIYFLRQLLREYWGALVGL